MHVRTTIALTLALMLTVTSAVARAQDEGSIVPGPEGRPISVLNEGNTWSAPLRVFKNSRFEMYIPDIRTQGWAQSYGDAFKKTGNYVVFIYSYNLHTHTTNRQTAYVNTRTKIAYVIVGFKTTLIDLCIPDPSGPFDNITAIVRRVANSYHGSTLDEVMRSQDEQVAAMACMAANMGGGSVACSTDARSYHALRTPMVTLMKQIIALTPRPASKPCKGVPTTTQAEIDAAAHGAPTPSVSDASAPSDATSPDNAAQKAAELKDEQAVATEKIKELMPQYKQAIAQLAQTTLQLHQQYQLVQAQKYALERTPASPTPTQQQLAQMRQEVQEKGPAAFALKDGNNVTQAIAAHEAAIQKCNEQLNQIKQQETQAGQTVSQLSSQLLTQQMTLRGKPVAITVASTDYRALTLHMADATVQREIGVIEQVIHGPDNEACVTEIDTDTRICTTYSYLPSQGLIGDYSVIARKAGATSYEVSAN
jgi:hypothetical protein